MKYFEEQYRKMDSLIKTRVSLETAQKLVVAHFGKQAKIYRYTELLDGYFSAVYFIRLTDGQELVLKVAPSDHVRVLRYEKNIMRTDVEVLRLVSNQTEAPCPKIFVYDTCRNLIDNDYYLMTFAPGICLHKLRQNLSAAEQYEIDFRTGQYLRQINAIKNHSFGYFSQPKNQASTWREAFSNMLEWLLQDGLDAGVELPIPYDFLFPWLQTFYSSLDDVQHPVLVHWDLWDGNIVVDPETRKITGLLDFERSLWGDPLIQVNFGAFGSIHDGFVEGYGLDLLAMPGAKVRRSLYNIYLWLIMIIECSYRHYETKEQENWSRLKLMEEVRVLEACEHI